MPNKSTASTALSVADAVSWFLALVLVTVIMVISLKEEHATVAGATLAGGSHRPCLEIYAVEEEHTTWPCDEIYAVEEEHAAWPCDEIYAVEEEHATVAGASLAGNGHRPCDEIYVVGDGETLHTISDKCGDPFIVERNPHIHDPDDVFPGLAIMIKPSRI